MRAGREDEVPGAEKMKSPAPLQGDPRTPELERLLVEDPYEVPVRGKERKNRTNNLFIREDSPSTAQIQERKNRMRRLISRDNVSSPMVGGRQGAALIKERKNRTKNLSFQGDTSDTISGAHQSSSSQPSSTRREERENRMKNPSFHEDIPDTASESHPSSSVIEWEGGGGASESNSSENWKRPASEEAEVVDPPRQYRRLRKAYAAPTSKTSIQVEVFSSDSSEGFCLRQDRPGIKSSQPVEDRDSACVPPVFCYQGGNRR